MAKYERAKKGDKSITEYKKNEVRILHYIGCHDCCRMRKVVAILPAGARSQYNMLNECLLKVHGSSNTKMFCSRCRQDDRMNRSSEKKKQKKEPLNILRAVCARLCALMILSCVALVY